MAVEISWYDEQERVAHIQFIDNWRWEELYPPYETLMAKERHLDQRTDVIVDLTRSGKLPPNVISHVQTMAQKRPDNRRLSVFVLPTGLQGALFNIVTQLSPKAKANYRSAADVRTAYNVILQDRESKM